MIITFFVHSNHVYQAWVIYQYSQPPPPQLGWVVFLFYLSTMPIKALHVVWVISYKLCPWCLAREKSEWKLWIYSSLMSNIFELLWRNEIVLTLFQQKAVIAWAGCGGYKHNDCYISLLACSILVSAMVGICMVSYISMYKLMLFPKIGDIWISSDKSTQVV